MSTFEFYAFRIAEDGTWSRLPDAVWAENKAAAEILAKVHYRGRLIVQSRVSYEQEQRERTYGRDLED
jgi:hypothetical protein